MAAEEVDFRATTTAVLEGFSHGFSEMVITLLEQRNAVMTTPDGKKMGVYAKVRTGYGLLIMADNSKDNEPFTITTEFLVPSKDLAASFMVMWRRWCYKRNISSNDGLLRLMNRLAVDLKTHIEPGSRLSNSNYALGLMGAVLDNYPGIVDSMRWSVDSGFVPCLVIANNNNVAKCGVCYGGRYMEPQMESQVYETQGN